MNLIEHETTEKLRREAAAERLRDIADQLSRQNSITFVKEGITHTVKVPDDVIYELEIEVGNDESEIEMSVKWGPGAED